MATNTPNYGLKKPNVHDIYHVEDSNTNMDKIDTQMKTNSSKIGQLENSLGTSNNEINSLKNKDTNLENKINEVDKNRTHYATAVGTNNYSCTVNGTNLYTGMRIFLRINTTNTGNSTLNVNNTGAKGIVYNHKDLVGGELDKDNIICLVLDGQYWKLLPTPTTVQQQSSEESKKQIDDIQIGGRNLLKNSKRFVVLPDKSALEVANFNCLILNIDNFSEPLKLNQTYTISAEIEITDGDFDKVSVYDYPGGTDPQVSIINNKIQRTFTKLVDSVNEILIYAGISGETRGNGIILRNVKVEEGNKATAWSKAPEDLVEESNQYTDTKISEENTKIETNKNNIAGNLNKISGNTGNITTNRNSIATNKNNISNNLGKINANTRNISSNTNKINTNIQAISTANGKINTNKNNINSNLGQINTLKNGKLDKSSYNSDDVLKKLLSKDTDGSGINATTIMSHNISELLLKKDLTYVNNQFELELWGTKVIFGTYSGIKSSGRINFNKPFSDRCYGVILTPLSNMQQTGMAVRVEDDYFKDHFNWRSYAIDKEANIAKISFIAWGK